MRYHRTFVSTGSDSAQVSPKFSHTVDVYVWTEFKTGEVLV